MLHRMKLHIGHLFVGVGLAGVAFEALFIWLFFWAVGPDPQPGGIAFAFIFMAMAMIQAVPIAGLPADFLRRRGPRKSRLSRPWMIALVLFASLFVLASLYLSTPPFLPLLLHVAASALFAPRLAALRRGWIVAWLVYVALCFALNGLFLFFLWTQR